MVLDVIVHSAEKYIGAARTAEVARGDQSLYQSWHFVACLGNVGTDMIDQENTAEIRPDNPGHQKIIERSIAET